MLIATILGARPQFIKASVVSRELARQGISETIVHTGQHFDINMSDVFFKELEIPLPAYNLRIGGGTHGENTGRMIEAIEKSLLSIRPDWVLVYGDTDSTLAGALAAVKIHIPVAHIEAGLRSFNMKMPEEINRILTDHASSLLFAPTKAAVQHLNSEGIRGVSVQMVGDVMFDAAIFFGAKAETSSRILQKIGINTKSYILATIHRAENTDDKQRLVSILEGFHKTDQTIVWPLHPRTKARLNAYCLTIPKNIIQIEPVGYLDMVMLEKNAICIATDSGGVQKEAFFYQVPCVTLRDETEWVELVDSGWNQIASPSNTDRMVEILLNSLNKKGENVFPYGKGDAAKKIIYNLNKQY